MNEKAHYENIIGGTEEDKSVAKEKLQKLFDGDGGFSEYEIEKSEDDVEIIKKTELIVNNIVSRYGGDTKELPLKNIHILRGGGVFEKTEGAVNGLFSYSLHIGVEKKASKFVFSGLLAHELFHLKSYKSACVGDVGDDVWVYRSGFSMFDRKNDKTMIYFLKLEEAIVAECTKIFLKEIEKEYVSRDEINATKKIKEWITKFAIKKGTYSDEVQMLIEDVNYIDDPQNIVDSVISFSKNESERQSFATGMFDARLKKGDIRVLERGSERKMLYKLLDTLVVNSNGKFKNRDEVFDEFAKANFSGNYLNVARIVENILGRGSFRKLAEEFSNIEK